MKKNEYKLHWKTWAWIIPLSLIFYTAIASLFGRDPLSTYQWVAGNFMSALDSASEGNFGSLLLFVFVGALVLCFSFWWTYWEQNKADKTLDETQLKEWARRNYLKQHGLESSDD